MYIILAILGGFLTILSMVVNANLAKKVGVFQGTFINYVVGSSIIFLIVLFIQDYSYINNLADIPFYAYLGGTIGVLVVAASNVIIPKIPTIYTTLLIFIGQIFMGIVIDYFRISHVSKGKVIGGVLIILGMLYNTNIDKKQLINENIISKK